MSNNLGKIRGELEQMLPEGFLDIASGWMTELDFDLKITSPRKTKLGDFRYDRKTGKHYVSVNRGDNPWSFLITFAHEAAHSKVYREYGTGCQHHGKEWKSIFRQFLLQLLSTGKIPDDLARPLAAYSRNPRASTYSFTPLVLGLKKMESNSQNLMLIDISPGHQFRFNGKVYTFLTKRRTRALCELQPSGRKYLIPLTAEIAEI